MHRTDPIYAKNLTEKQFLNAPAQTTETAAQSAHSQISDCLARARGLAERLDALAERLGVDVQQSVGKEPRPVRSGIFGNIHDTADTIGQTIDYMSTVLGRIETQI